MSCARVQQYSVKEITASERHNERKNTDYSNLNVDMERIPLNVHFKDPGDKTYLQVLKEKEDNGELSRRGLREDAKVFDEIVFDINTLYFHENGGYEFAKVFYKEAYRYACKKFGEENIVSAVMHADELNKAATEQYGYPIYHYHLHVIAFPVIKKEILWSKRCKNANLIGTVKEVINQISHSKKWESKETMIDDYGNPVYTKSGKPVFRKSYSVLQDEFYNHMIDHGYEGFVRGKEGSSLEHLSSLDFQIKKDEERLSAIQRKVRVSEETYSVSTTLDTTNVRIEEIGRKNPITKSVTVTKEEYDELTTLAKEGISNRIKIQSLREDLRDSYRRNSSLAERLNTLEENYELLWRKCRPYLDAVRQFPALVSEFIERVRLSLEDRIKASVEREER
ncbi:MAG: plasmid recombination protein [Oscillospiraceae bacterium]|nr:plasmid recombination protein [Oscillospiraceae bacterium]